MTTAEKVAYLRGLAEGYGTDPATKEGKLLTTIVDILEDLALDLEDLGADVAELSDDLEDVEELLYDDEDNVGEDDEDEDDEDGEPWDGETVFYECECPNCGETVTFEESVLEKGSIQCPACGEILEFIKDDEDAEKETPAE